jgi:hypothetical protein
MTKFVKIKDEIIPLSSLRNAKCKSNAMMKLYPSIGEMHRNHVINDNDTMLP